ncbi:MAG TPA: DUF1080 domain-containing protein [Fimbriimonadaceae bacterium]|nr:DUF1080 domain-containing protein [Fimbriimonadaceae bacterium]HRJ95145.1 DUF1080 domain-containing protein [Fimbriimonadaceae bacterium]
MIELLVACCLLTSQDNALSADEVKDGWRLLFDGKSTAGWTNYNSKTIGKGWKVVDGALMCADPGTAGDIVTGDMYDWFDLTLDFKVTKGGNSGIIFRVADGSKQTWNSGPEVQIYDHPAEKGVEITGYLYQLYAGEVDASKPAGEWNRLRIVLTPAKGWTEVNGVKYYEYVWGSEDFKSRIAKSKFAQFPEFAKAARGRIAIQGDHGVVSFKNVKIRPLK